MRGPCSSYSQAATSIRPLVGGGRVLARDDWTQPIHIASWLDDQVTFDHREWRCSEVELRWTAGSHLVVLTDDGATAQTQVRLGGRCVYEGRDRPGALTFIPAAADRHCAYRSANLTYTALWINPAIQSRLVGCEGLSLAPVVNGGDSVVETLLTSLRQDIVSGCTPPAAYIEHLVAVILLRLATLDGRGSALGTPRGALSRRTLTRVQDYIEANIRADISLSELAELAGLPVATFARRFRAATGVAPYTYVLERRVRRAEALLRATSDDISSIATSLGFSSQSHLTTTFRRITGTTPRGYRRGMMNA